MYSLAECFKSVEFRISKTEYNMDLFAKIVQECGPATIFVKNSISDVPRSLNSYHSADSKPLLTSSKSQVADLFAN